MGKIEINEDEIYNIAEQFRLAILNAKFDRRFHHRDRMSNFPSGCCDDASDLFAYYLMENYNLYTEQGNGTYRDENPYNTTNHAWLVLNRKIIIDITATQFMFCGAFSKDIYVGKSFSFYNNLEKVKICENYDITQSERLWNDYKIIMSYMPEET